MRWKKRHSCLKETRRALDRLWLDLFPLVTPNLVTLDEKNPDLNEAVLASFQDIYYSLEDHYKLGEGAVRHLDRTSWSKPMDKLRAVYRLEKKVSKLMGDAQTLEAKVEDFLSKEGIDFGCHVRRPRVAKYVKVATSPSSQV
ncbi:unnamed protein product [Somion occarium]|uniref:Uncharacterized protein n=1 Tax=Somion occarium TaxID=3059160 RepID=A0ABP1E286_9APHY